MITNQWNLQSTRNITDCMEEFSSASVYNLSELVVRLQTKLASDRKPFEKSYVVAYGVLPTIPTKEK